VVAAVAWDEYGVCGGIGQRLIAAVFLDAVVASALI
jgi:hypothetical protein